MKVRIVSFFDRVSYTIIVCVIIASFYFDAKISTYSKEMHNAAIYINNANPAQYIANASRGVVNYIIDFTTFRSQISQLENLKLQLESITVMREALIHDDQMIKETMQTYKNNVILGQSAIVKLVYSTDGDIISQTFFETPQNSQVKLNTIILNNNCILGRVYKQDEKNSYVLLYTDSKFRLPVYTEKSRVFGMVYGDGTPRFVTFTSSQDGQMQDGERLIIASADGIFAENIPFGTVNSQTKEITTECLNYYKYALAI
jgi:cell shape-determining protein MreC